MTKYYNIASPDIVSYRRYAIIGEYDNLADAKAAYESDIAAWKESNSSKAWYKMNYPFAYATIGAEIK